jgi:hypothetical protein
MLGPACGFVLIRVVVAGLGQVRWAVGQTPSAFKHESAGWMPLHAVIHNHTGVQQGFDREQRLQAMPLWECVEGGCWSSNLEVVGHGRDH